VFLESERNLGFAGGNNAALEIALGDGDELVYLLNPDTEVDPRFLAEALEVLRADDAIGLVQSLLLRHPQTDLVNTWGNELQFLGFGHVGGDGVALEATEAAARLTVRDIAYASGAGMLVRASVLRQIGLFHEELFAYDEDLDLSWRARLAGHRIVLAPRSIVFHKYEFSRGAEKYYLLERNRFLVLARCYRLPTTILILPALLAMELGIWAFALRSGWWREKARSYRYLGSPRRWRELRRGRRAVQRLRTVSDREATALFTGEVVFEQLQPVLLTCVANPVFRAYWRVARCLMFW
jgi:GT2 family glycosyltransferase